MNRLQCEIKAVESSGSFSLVDLWCGENLFSSIVMEDPAEAPWLHAGNRVLVLFKETEVSLSTAEPGPISLRNRMHGPVVGLDRGKILSRVEVRFMDLNIVSIVTTRSVNNLGIELGKEVYALVKATELMLMKEESP